MNPEFPLRTTGWRNGRLPPVTPLNPFILLYLIFSLIAFLVSPLPMSSLPRLLLVGGGVLGFFAAYRWLDSPTRLRQLREGVLLAGGIVALVGLVTVEWPAQYLFDLRPLLSHLPRLFTNFTIHPNEIAGLLALLLPLAWGIRPFTLSHRRRLGLFTSVALMSLMLLFTQSRNAWLALLVAWVAYRLWGRVQFAYLASTLALMIAIPFTLNVLPETAQNRVQQTLLQLDDATKSGENDEPSWLLRLEIWQVAGQMAADYPVLGGGLYTFEPTSRANYIYTLVPPHFNFTHTHNLFWQTAVNLGVIGLLLLLGIWGAALWGLWQQQPQVTTGDGEQWTAVFGAALVGHLWFNLFDIAAWEQWSGLFIWLLLAAALRLSPAPRAVSAKKIGVALGAVWAVWLLLLLSPLGQQNRQRLRLDQARFAQTAALSVSPTAFSGDPRRQGVAHFLRQDVATAVTIWQTDAQSGPFLRQQGVIAFYAGEWETAVTWLTLAVQIDTTDSQTHYWLGRVYEIQGQPAAALRQYDLALATLGEGETAVQTADIWAGRGRVLAHLTEWQAAAAAFTQAVALLPNHPDYPQQLNQLTLLLQQIEKESGNSP